MEENGLFCDKPLGWKPGKEEEGWRNSTAIDSAHAPHAHLTSECNGALRWGLAWLYPWPIEALHWICVCAWVSRQGGPGLERAESYAEHDTSVSRLHGVAWTEGWAQGCVGSWRCMSNNSRRSPAAPSIYRYT